MGKSKPPLVATVMKLEAPYVIEWVAWQRLQGFDVMIADNCTEGQQTALLRALSEAGYIHYVDARHLTSRPQLPGLELIFRDAEMLGYRVLGFMDVDEFIELLGDDPFGGAILITELMLSPMTWAVSFRWAMFGSAGRVQPGEGLVVERFTMRSTPDHARNGYVKSFVKIKSLRRWQALRRRPLVRDPHVFGVPSATYLLEGIRGRKQVFDRPQGDWKLARIRHYAVKSREEFAVKRSRGDAFYDAIAPAEEYLAANDLNDVADPLAPGVIERVRTEVDDITRSIGAKV